MTKVYAWKPEIVIPEGIEGVQKHVHLLSGRMMVEMVPQIGEMGGIELLESTKRRWRPCFGIVLAVGRIDAPQGCEAETFSVGDVVMVHPQDGKRIEGWSCACYTAKQEVRLLGIVCEHWGSPLKMPLTESVFARYDPRSDTYRSVLANVLLRLPDRREKTESGIILPDNLKRRVEDTGIIVSMGPHCRELKKEGIKVGDNVIFERRALKELKFDGHEDLAQIEETGIYGKVS